MMTHSLFLLLENNYSVTNPVDMNNLYYQVQLGSDSLQCLITATSNVTSQKIPSPGKKYIFKLTEDVNGYHRGPNQDV